MACYLERYKDKLVLSSSTKYFLIFLCVRLSSVLLVQTWFVPDEYWQSMEVAHKMVFGYGYTTWEWVLGLRSYLHPLLIAMLYKFLHALDLDSVTLLVVGPRIGQAVLSAYADLKFYQWSGNQKWAAFTIATSWFWYYTASRTLINSMETCLTIIALSQFPWPGHENRGSLFLWTVAVNVALRPTAALLWAPLCVYHLWSEGRARLPNAAVRYVCVGAVVLGLSAAVDSLCLGRPALTAWRFLSANVLEGVGAHYGTQPWHWYLTNGLPAVLGLHVVPLALAVWRVARRPRDCRLELVLLVAATFAVLALSCVSHKELRFVLPLLPLFLRLSAGEMSRWSRRAPRLRVWLAAAALLASNAAPAAYLGLVHQRGTLDVMPALARLAALRPNDTSLLFLMPCHSTPLYSHLHVDVPARFLTCEPLGDADEADAFYSDPNAWLHAEFPPEGALPSHIVAFDSLAPRLSSLLARYRPLHSFAHTDVPLSDRIGHHVLVYQHQHY